MKEKRRVFSWDVLRAICPMIIIAFHYSCTVDGESWRPLYTYANGNWGSLCVSVFFMLSGASLYSSHQGRDKIDSLQFYKKRFFSLFPMFYTVWIIMYIINALEKEKLFFAGSPVSILLSLIGMDGYFSYLGPNYFLNVGEWFLGALVWCYLFFPIMFKIAKKNYGGGGYS